METAKETKKSKAIERLAFAVQLAAGTVLGSLELWNATLTEAIAAAEEVHRIQREAER